MFGHRLPQRFDPENEVRRVIARGCGYDVTSRTGGLFGKPLQRRGQRLDRLRTIQLDLDLFKDRGELPSALATCGGQNLDGVTCQWEMVHHAEPSMGRGNGLHSLFACVGESAQVTSEVSAVDG